MAGIRVCGFWAKKSQDGKEYHEGTLGGVQVRLFVNDYKKSDKDPDVVMYFSPRPKEEFKQQPRPPQQRGNVSPQSSTPRSQQAKPELKPIPYKDHTADSKPWDDGSPWPEGDEGPPF